mmetsp:Transcript_46694/g.124825  ORF Transcript_46694/g.124825 Transcript_46694/m.124825 type:complete len:205 (-) Transcript_46694:750-1364(-)
MQQLPKSRRRRKMQMTETGYLKHLTLHKCLHSATFVWSSSAVAQKPKSSCDGGARHAAVAFCSGPGKLPASSTSRTDPAGRASNGAPRGVVEPPAPPPPPPRVPGRRRRRWRRRPPPSPPCPRRRRSGACAVSSAVMSGIAASSGRTSWRSQKAWATRFGFPPSTKCTASASSTPPRAPNSGRSLGPSSLPGWNSRPGMELFGI